MGGETGGAGLGVRGQDGRAEAAVEAGAEDCTRNVEAGADFALGGAVGCLGEVVQTAFALRG